MPQSVPAVAAPTAPSSPVRVPSTLEAVLDVGVSFKSHYHYGEVIRDGSPETQDWHTFLRNLIKKLTLG